MDVDDAMITFVGLDEMKHWNMAPSNLGGFEKQVSISAYFIGNYNMSDFTANVVRLLNRLSETKDWNR